ncbi:MAG: hypothetical protein KZQ76_04770 [Candidatus Thiodiazotropha sp. (ex Epidulcina cf. delphinae)]|nr:hypothetical protein [Candidatus Thiodiazotropha sp. (ex Epidulcina cf. delphinae)]
MRFTRKLQKTARSAWMKADSPTQIAHRLPGACESGYHKNIQGHDEKDFYEIDPGMA